ncbi:TfoX/Sxy family protein [uncultured Amaricoccus sp.]|uniref:TfoX/Sxy family protein n=1 Tax=uncultured Amaricoccus sp. TaxID=339341 RepID=UPI002610A359|nr:TfoX/Sxy family protein [uncultured Amaricoccus sp.]
MALPSDARALIEELFEGVGAISTRRLFGGLAIYSDGRVFALMMSDGGLFLKARDALAEALAAEGSTPFSYARKDGRVVAVGYWSLPQDALDDPEAAVAWARRALVATYGAA